MSTSSVSHGAATLGNTMVNASALLGGNTTFYCQVVGAQGLGETHSFVKVLSIIALKFRYHLRWHTTGHFITQKTYFPQILEKYRDSIVENIFIWGQFNIFNV